MSWSSMVLALLATSPPGVLAQAAPTGAHAERDTFGDDALRVAGEVALGEGLGLGLAVLTVLPFATTCFLGSLGSDDVDGDVCEYGLHTSLIASSVFGVAIGVSIAGDAPFVHALLGSALGTGAAYAVAIASGLETPWGIALLALPVTGSVLSVELLRTPDETEHARAPTASLSLGMAPLPGGGLGLTARMLTP